MSKILIIEDEEAIADLEKDYLELSAFEAVQTMKRNKLCPEMMDDLVYIRLK